MDVIPFQFEGMTLRESCWLDGHPHFTRRAIGDWLEAEHPQKYIDNILDRNPHIKTFSVPLKLRATDDKEYLTEVYNPIGLQLIINNSDLPKAIQFQVAAAHLVYAYMRGELKPSKWALKSDLVAASRQILSLPQGSKRASLVRDLAEQHGISMQTAYNRIKKCTGERFKTSKGKSINRADKGSTLYPEEKRKALIYAKENPGIGGKKIKKDLGLAVSYSSINAWIREATKAA